MSRDRLENARPEEGPATEQGEVPHQFVPARMSSAPRGEARPVSVGMVVHLWPKHQGDTAKALCGGFPRGVFSCWSETEDATDCTACMRVRSGLGKDMALQENFTKRLDRP
jgi:hypothetical protein